MFGQHKIVVYIRTPNGHKFGAKSVMTEEFVESVGMNVVAEEGNRVLSQALNEAYSPAAEFHPDGPYVTEIERRHLWSIVKNINTDDELEEIRRLLKIHEKDLQ